MLPQDARSLSAAFRHPEAQENLCLVLRGDEECRRGAAEIYSVNVHHPSVREISARHLATLFDAPSKRALSLERTPGPLPPELLAYAERALNVFEDQSRTSPPYALGIAYGLPAILLRFYQQSKDPTGRTHWLDLLDRMLALGWGEAAAELGKIDR